MTDLSDLTPLQYGARTEWHHKGAHLIFDQVVASSKGITAWVEVRWSGNAPPPRLLHFGTYNLLGARTVGALTNSIPDNYQGNFLWRELFTACVYHMVSTELEGSEPVRLVDVKPSDRPTWILPGLIPATGATAFLAAGGSMKSLLALAIACTVASGDTHFMGMKPRTVGPVCYFDWEADEDTHATRMFALSGDRPGPEDLWYFSESAPLARIADSVAKRADKLDAALVVVDSLMLARGGDPNQAEPSLAFYAALRQIGRPTVLVDHKSREAIRKGWSGALGSVVNDNTRRLTWEIRGPQPSTDGQVIRLDQGKTNDFGELPPIGFNVRIESNDDHVMTACRIRQTSPHNIVTFDPTSTTVDQIAGFLLGESEPQTVKDIAVNVETSDGAVRVLLSRHADKFINVGTASRGLWRVVGEARDDGEALPVPF